MKNKTDANLILVGVINSAHGINGDVIIKSFTDPTSNIFNMRLIDGNQQSINIQAKRLDKKGNIICKINRCRSRNEAEEIKGQKLFCNRIDFPEIENKNEFYIHDIIGIDVLLENNKKIGVVQNILNYGAGDIIEIKFIDSNSTEMFPFNKSFFPIIEKNYMIIKNL